MTTTITPTTVYLAGKMAGLTLEEMTAWRIKAREELGKNGFNVLDPTGLDFNDRNIILDSEVVHCNKFQIRHSDVLLVQLDHKDVSIGTVGEIVFASELGKPVVIWGSAPVEIIGHPWIMHHSTMRFLRLKDAVDYIIKNYSKGGR